MLMMLTDAVSCYVQLHGYGFTGDDHQPDWYRAVALNGVEIMNVTRSPLEIQGIYTYVVHPTSCSASDYQHFNTYNDDSSSDNLISYVQALANG